ncbi:AAA family ATPase [Actinoplanes sp. NPDC051346]|uniref:MinD/ParA family ATP-binding protein n=1 Tax=Actinoplanes sp. NPDC051346 TaxID=3155048 RepID=UPI00341C3F8B
MDGTETGWGRPAEPAPRWRALLDRARHASRTGDEAEEAEATEGRRPTSGPPLPSRQPGRPFNPLDPRMREHAARDAAPNGYAPAEPPRRPPINPLDRRPGRASLGERLGATEPLPPPADPRIADPRLADPRQADPRLADPRAADPRLGDPRQADPRLGDPRQADPRPAHSLEARRQSRISEGFHARPEAEPHSYFNPATRAVPPSIGRVVPEHGMPQGRGAAPIGSASVLRPPVAPPQAAAPPLTAPPLTAPPQDSPPAVVAPPAAPAPVSPAPARIEWRQTRPEPEDRAAGVLRRKLGKPRVLAFANPKGGVHKTTATVLAAATIGSVRGRGVLAWDDNELRGTLGLRAGSARHARTIRHLVGDLIEIENMHGNDLMHFFDGYLRHASDGSYDVLAGEENPRFAQRLDQSTVRRVMDLLRRTHDVICVDTGNNVESVNWQTVMRSADQLVVTTVPREDAAFTADWMLDVLNETGMEDLVANAVTLISCPSPGNLPLLDDLAKHFATRTREVAVVPYDPALEVGSSIEYAVLQPETKQAWLRAAAVMIEPFAE